MKIAFRDDNFSFEFLRLLGESVNGWSGISRMLCHRRPHPRRRLWQSWFQDWNDTAVLCIHQIAQHCLAQGHPVSARQAFLRPPNRSSLCRVLHAHAYRENDPCPGHLSEKRRLFPPGLAVFLRPREQVSIPYAGTRLPGYFTVDSSAIPVLHRLSTAATTSMAHSSISRLLPDALERRL